MSVLAYSYKLKTVINLLNEVEYAPINASISEMMEQAKAHRHQTGFIVLKSKYADLQAGKEVLILSQEIADVTSANPLSALCLRASQYGRLCPSCEKPFRTPRAKLCAECGYALPEGEVAGPLIDG